MTRDDLIELCGGAFATPTRLMELRQLLARTPREAKRAWMAGDFPRVPGNEKEWTDSGGAEYGELSGSRIESGRS